MTHYQFHKMHGLGNDFVIVDARQNGIEISSAQAAAIANRTEGIGCDQLILLCASEKADVAMRIYNQDGGEVEACGNASRCVSALLGGEVSIETAGGLISGQQNNEGAVVNMGTPSFTWDSIPLAYAVDTLNIPIGWEDLDNPVAVNVGNPHVIFFIDENPNCVELERLGPLIEHDPLFPERVNVNVAKINGNRIDLRVWERGTGLTRACGTGACATAVAAIKRGLVQSPVQVNLPGGSLSIRWVEGDGIFMQGPATYVFGGTLDLDNFDVSGKE